MRLIDRITKLESIEIPQPREHFPTLRRMANADIRDFGFALEDGFLPNMTERPEVAALLECEELTPEQGAVLGAAAREVMANETPKGTQWAFARRAL